MYRTLLILAFSFTLTTTGLAQEPRKLPIIDTHTHFYDPTRPKGVPWPSKNDKLLYRRVLPGEYERLAKPFGVVGTIVVEASPWIEDNQWLLDLAEKEPFLVGVVGRLDPAADDFEKNLRRFVKNPLYRGIRISHQELIAGLKSNLVERCKLLADRNLVLDVNGGPDMPGDVARLAGALPRLKIVINHAANLRIDGKKPPQKWAQGMATAAKHPNVFCKVSALVEQTGQKPVPRELAYYRPVIDTLWNEFGEDRLIFGSNWPVSDGGAPFATVVGIVQDYFAAKGERAAIKFFHDNSKKVYGWQARTSSALPQEELRARLARSPREVAEQLAAVYGKKLDQVAYIPALPLVAKLRLSELTCDPKYKDEVARIVAPFLRGDKSPIPKSGSEQAGHLIFAELAQRAKDKDRERWIQLCRNAADQIFDKAGKALPIMPYHNEMSDAVFMAGPILAATGKLTGERKYFDAAVNHFASMRKVCLRRDGLYRHSPLCEAAWGRGNGFPAIGLALALSDWPEEHPAKRELIAEFQKHMAALKPHQDAKTGCWHQVIDHPESYDEYSCTCMIGFAMQRGIRRGWLKESEYQPNLDRAWRAIKERTSFDGKLVNVCTGTGKQKTLRDYFERPAINGRDDRGGAMGLLFAVELLAAD